MNEEARDVECVFLMVMELHRRGFERLRIIPGLSSSNLFYRCGVTAAQNVFSDHGAMAVTHTLVAEHTSANRRAYFGWDDDMNARSPEALANIFIKRFSRIGKHAVGSDPTYTEWFGKVMALVSAGEFPVAYDGFFYGRANPSKGQSRLPTTMAYYSCLPMPPPGRSKKKLFASEA